MKTMCRLKSNEVEYAPFHYQIRFIQIPSDKAPVPGSLF